MGRFTANEAENYGGGGGGNFFSLKNDKDVATVRFMYNTIDDFEGFAVHEIEVDGKKRYVNCLRAYNEPVSDCPLCDAKYPVKAKAFIYLYDIEAEEMKIWDRGKTFVSKLSSLCSRYNPLVGVPFEIERNGKKGDTNTVYETFALDADGTTLEDLPEIPPLLGTLILDKTFEELADFLETGSFPDIEEEPVSRRNPAKDRAGTAQKDRAVSGRRISAAPAQNTANPAPTQRPAPRSTVGRSSTNRSTDRF